MGKRSNKAANTRNAPTVDEIPNDESDDEEIDEDEAFNSDDERKYGCFFDKSSSKPRKKGDGDDSGEDESGSSDIDSIESEDDDSKAGDGGQYMLDLLDKLDSNNEENSKSEGTPRAASAVVATHVKESEFSSAVVPKAGLTLDSLMDGLQDTEGFTKLQKTMKKVAQGQATAAPLARVVSERTKRKVHYKDQSKDISMWIDAVKQNREAETLDFRPKERLEVTRDVLVDKFVPTSKFEKELDAALKNAGQKDEESMLRAEEAALQDDLGANQITMEDYKKRRGQLAKMRALMFYHEQKRHKINKIKSKKYRRIRKKQRERAKGDELDAQVQEDPVLAKELEEKEEVERMKERMTLAHKNTSKWAKRILKRGKNVDVDTRRALSAQLKRGDDLRQKMTTTRAGERDEDDSDEDLIESARGVLADAENDGGQLSDGKGLFKLSFMQRGIERQREKAKEEARRLLLELESNENEHDPDADASDTYKETDSMKPKKAKIASKQEMKQVLAKGELIASSLQFGNSNLISVSGDIDIDMGLSAANQADNKKSKDKLRDRNATVSEHSAILNPINTDEHQERQELSEASIRCDNPPRAQAPELRASVDEESNPWLVTNNDSVVKGGGSSLNKTSKGKNGVVDLERAVELMENVRNVPSNIEGADHSNGAPEKDIDTLSEQRNKKIITLTQEELIRKAFATPSDKEAEEEFAKDREIIEESEDSNRKKKKDKNMEMVSGWGSWTGKGAPPPRKPRKLPMHLRPPERKLTKRKRQDEKKPHVIISEKRVKKLADNFMVAQIPYPYTSREEYERAMAGGLGREWNVTNSFKDMTRPEIMTRPGKVIQPLSKKVKQRRPAAKF